MKKILLAMITLFTVSGFSQQVHAGLVEYGVIGKIKSISKANVPDLKVGDQVYLNFKIDPLTAPAFGDKNLALYHYAVKNVGIWFYKTNIFNSYHSGIYNDKTDKVKTSSGDASIFATYETQINELEHVVDQKVYSSKSLTNSNYRVNDFSMNVVTLLDNDPVDVLPAEFKLSEASNKTTQIFFKNTLNQADSFAVSIDIIRIVYDNPDNLNDQMN